MPPKIPCAAPAREVSPGRFWLAPDPPCTGQPSPPYVHFVHRGTDCPLDAVVTAAAFSLDSLPRDNGVGAPALQSSARKLKVALGQQTELTICPKVTAFCFPPPNVKIWTRICHCCQWCHTVCRCPMPPLFVSSSQLSIGVSY